MIKLEILPVFLGEDVAERASDTVGSSLERAYLCQVNKVEGCQVGSRSSLIESLGCAPPRMLCPQFQSLEKSLKIVGWTAVIAERIVHMWIVEQDQGFLELSAGVMLKACACEAVSQRLWRDSERRDVRIPFIQCLADATTLSELLARIKGSSGWDVARPS